MNAEYGDLPERGRSPQKSLGYAQMSGLRQQQHRVGWEEELATRSKRGKSMGPSMEAVGEEGSIALQNLAGNDRKAQGDQEKTMGLASTTSRQYQKRTVNEPVSQGRDGWGKQHIQHGPPLPPKSVPSNSNTPYHIFSRSVKIAIVAMVSSSALLSGLSSNIYFPAQKDISIGLNTTPAVVNFSITTYLIAQGFAPSFWGPLADLYGRRIILIATLAVYVVANVALALVQNPAMLLLFRAVQAIGCTSTISLGAGVISDIVGPEKRGGYMGAFSGARQTSIAIGPVLGGLLAGYLGFRSIFWFLVILSGCTLLLIILALPETLRRIAGNGSITPAQFRYRPLLALLPRTCASRRPRPRQQEEGLRIACTSELKERPKFKWSVFIQPFSMLTEKDVGCALLFGACTYTAWSMMVATTTVLFKSIYDFSTVQVGLSFLANGLGCALGSAISGRTLNAHFRREAEHWHHVRMLPVETSLPRPLPTSFPIERARLSDAPLYSLTMIVMFLVFGWGMSPSHLSSAASTTASGIPTAANAVAGHWIVPLLAQFAIGYSNTAVLNSNNVLVLDLYPGSSASASAVINLSRNLLAAVGVAVVDYIEDAVLPGWLGAILAALVMIGLVPYGLHAVYGAKWRVEREMRKAMAS